MRNLFTFIFFLLVGTQFLAAQDQSAPANTVSVSWNEKTHEFGKIIQNEPTSVTFTFTNNSQVPVVITAARSSCGCTVAEYTKEPVKPGEKGEVKATYNSAKLGAFTKTIAVSFEGNATADILAIKGEVQSKPVE